MLKIQHFLAEMLKIHCRNFDTGGAVEAQPGLPAPEQGGQGGGEARLRAGAVVVPLYGKAKSMGGSYPATTKLSQWGARWPCEHHG